MMLVSIFLVMLPSLRAALVDCAAAPTFTDTDPNTGESLQCDSCPPGTYLRARCTSTQKSVCASCPSGSFTELWNYIGKCLRCGVCGYNQVEKKACSADSDCQCECKQGYHYKKKFDMCLRHSDCPAGQGPLSIGTPHEDTVCHVCPNGTYSDVVSAQQNCTEHRSCAAAGLQVVLRGSTWHDTVCASSQELQSRDGAEYLREILPAFFVHQKMPLRRLRQVVHKLSSEDSKRQGGTSRLNPSELDERINAWIASASAKQVRDLPAALRKAGASSAADRLQNKLRRIDSHLEELSDLRNEVDVV
uniref:tumor necrosis factor receptor superfamily member 6B-like isoform X2 n=1 Tax=Scatophagus argus TaxID=75038 RepID=UPI001ED82959|nr:tumor necrosis factor receptor superfamily member 6B-like isoform X2 [Scatophagus argus]